MGTRVNKSEEKVKLSQQLVVLSDTVRGDDRVDLAREIGISYSSINRYFTGIVGSIPIARTIVEKAKKLTVNA